MGGISRKRLKVGSVEWDGEELPMIGILKGTIVSSGNITWSAIVITLAHKSFEHNKLINKVSVCTWLVANFI